MKNRDQSAVLDPEASPPSPLGTGAGIDPVRNVIGESLVIKGELSASEDLIVRGQVEGSISLPGHTLTVELSANVAAKIAARAVIVAGNVTER